MGGAAQRFAKFRIRPIGKSVKKNKRVKLQKNRVLLLLCIILGISVTLLTMTIFMDTSRSVSGTDEPYKISSVTIDSFAEDDPSQKELTPVPVEPRAMPDTPQHATPDTSERAAQNHGASQVLRSENGEVIVDTRYVPFTPSAHGEPQTAPDALSTQPFSVTADARASLSGNATASGGTPSFAGAESTSDSATSATGNAPVAHTVTGTVSRTPTQRSVTQDGTLLHNVTPPATAFEANTGIGTADGALRLTQDVSAKEAKLVFVIDDAGHNLTQLEPFLQLPFPVTVAVLPALEYSVQAAEKTRRAGKEVLLHQPMQAKDLKINPGPAAITPKMSADEIASLVKKNVASLGGVKGINNHEGSLITENAVQLGAVFDVCKEQNLFFLDSRTTSQTVARKVASSRSMRIWERSVFLDNSSEKEDIVAAVRLGMDIATKNGIAIMIGHAWSDNLAAILLELYPEMLLQGYKITAISDL